MEDAVYMLIVEIHPCKSLQLETFGEKKLVCCQFWAKTLFFLDTFVILFMGTELLL